jgi:NitT/TauT family transport system ATP-binding protein
MRLVLEGVGHAYDKLEVLDGIDLDIQAGERLVLVGPSGCGKSTLLAILGGLLSPTRGRVLLDGKPPQGCLNPLTYVFQDFALLPWRTVAGNVALPLEGKLGDAERRDRVAESLKATSLTEFAEVYPRQLSGGMRQRVGIARALAVRPAVLLMDEPLSALDAQTRELLLEEFTQLWQRSQATTVYVTHNLDEALHLADRICVLSRRPGRIKAVVPVGLAIESRSNPEHAAALTGLHGQLWGLIRDEVLEADREIAEEEAHGR